VICKSMRVIGPILILAALIISQNETEAGDERKMGGWGVDDLYNKHYRIANFEKFKAKVLRIKEVIPMPGMTPGVAMYVKSDGKVIEVQICPTWFVKADEIGIKKGDRVNIRGVWATMNNKKVFIASKIKKEAYFELKVRFTKDGTPFWTMTPDEVAEEKEEKGEDDE